VKKVHRLWCEEGLQRRVHSPRKRAGTSSVPEVIADAETGYIVPVQDYPQQAAAALKRLGEIDPAACRARVEELFSAQAMVRGYEAVYEQALAGA